MPLIRRKPFEKNPIPDDLKDTDEVFYCELSKEIFIDYENYFERVMLFNSTVWSCSMTSRPNLTYSEALDSEKKARKSLKSFIQEIKTPIVYIAALTRRTGFNDMVDDIFSFINVRYFKDETVLSNRSPNKKNSTECKVLAVIGNSNESSPIYFAKVKYRVKATNSGETWVAEADQIRRPRLELTKDKLKLFLKQCVDCSDIGMFKVKDSMYQKYVIDANVTKFSDIFVGKPPSFKLSDKLKKKESEQTEKDNQQNKKKKKKSKDEKQPKISNFLSKKDKNENKTKTENKVKKEPANSKSLVEEMNRLKEAKEKELERLKKVAEEQHRQRMEFVHLCQATVKYFNQIRDDLELQDQKLFPPLKNVNTLISTNNFGDALMVLEFVYSLTSVLEDKDKFPNSINLDILQRALLCREVAGPLSDIIQVLLGTIFSFQIEEASETMIKYEKNLKNQNEIIQNSTMAALWPTKYLSMKLQELPMDATTLTELLRLHLLMSGAKIEESGASWRYQQRGGYRSTDDPGLNLKQMYPHILRALNFYTVYQLPIEDILIILKCLISQILTYPQVKDLIEERVENASKARTAMKNICLAERKRENTTANMKKELFEEVKNKVKLCEGTQEEKDALNKQLTEDLDPILKNIDAQSEKSKTKFTKEFEECQNNIFAYQLYLGSDRAFRAYWLFESLPGLFIEHAPFGGKCIDNPVQNIDGLASSLPLNRYAFIKKMLLDSKNGNNKENKNHNTIEINNKNIEIDIDSMKKNVPNISQRELLMCTGETEICPVHAVNDPERMVWSFLNTEEELNALINSLNPRGIREKILKEQLESEKTLILNHINDCPVNKLQESDSDKSEKIQNLLCMKQYTNANMNFPPDTDINVIMEQTLVNNILELELNITIGHLGSLKVRDRDVWRKALENISYDMQCDYLKWGPGGQYYEGKLKSNGFINTDIKGQPLPYDDPGTSVENINYKPNNGYNNDDGLALNASSEFKTKVHNYASALLQVAYSIDAKFLKPPFGVFKDYKDPAVQEKHMKVGTDNLENWSVALMNSTSYSQVYLYYSILHDAVKWSKSSCNARCTFCRRMTDADKMLLCDGCNSGKHLFCFKPKLTKVPDDDWFCEKCKPVEVQKKLRSNKKKIFTISSDEDLSEDGGEDDVDIIDDDAPQFYKPIDNIEDDDLEECVVCCKPGRRLATCKVCAVRVHLKCAVPPLLSMPNKNSWICSSCKRKKRSKPPAKRPHKIAVTISSEGSESEEENLRVKTKKNKKFDSDDSDISNESIAKVIKKPRKTVTNASAHEITKKFKKVSKPILIHEESDTSSDVIVKKLKKPQSSSKLISDSDSDNEPLNNQSNGVKKRAIIVSDSNDEIPAKKISKSRKSTSNDSNSEDEVLANLVKKHQTTVADSVMKDVPTNGKKRTFVDIDDSDDEVINIKRRKLTESSPNTSNHKNSKRNKTLSNKKAKNKTNGTGTFETVTLSSSRRSRRTGDELLLDNISLHTLLGDIAKHSDSWPFERPVNRHDVPDYYEVIEHPMDLAKIKSKLNLGEYNSNYDIMNDIQLIFTNCDLYNISGTKIYNSGLTLERFVQKRCAELNLPFRPSDMMDGLSS